jgi:hypothetical protein
VSGESARAGIVQPTKTGADRRKIRSRDEWEKKNFEPDRKEITTIDMLRCVDVIVKGFGPKSL